MEVTYILIKGVPPMDEPSTLAGGIEVAIRKTVHSIEISPQGHMGLVCVDGRVSDIDFDRMNVLFADSPKYGRQMRAEALTFRPSENMWVSGLQENLAAAREHITLYFDEVIEGHGEGETECAIDVSGREALISFPTAEGAQYALKKEHKILERPIYLTACGNGPRHISRDNGRPPAQASGYTDGAPSELHHRPTQRQDVGHQTTAIEASRHAVQPTTCQVSNPDGRSSKPWENSEPHRVPPHKFPVHPSNEQGYRQNQSQTVGPQTPDMNTSRQGAQPTIWQVSSPEGYSTKPWEPTGNSGQHPPLPPQECIAGPSDEQDSRRKQHQVIGPQMPPENYRPDRYPTSRQQAQFGWEDRSSPGRENLKPWEAAGNKHMADPYGGRGDPQLQGTSSWNAAWEDSRQGVPSGGQHNKPFQDNTYCGQGPFIGRPNSNRDGRSGHSNYPPVNTVGGGDYLGTPTSRGTEPRSYVYDYQDNYSQAESSSKVMVGSSTKPPTEGHQRENSNMRMDETKSTAQSKVSIKMKHDKLNLADIALKGNCIALGKCRHKIDRESGKIIISGPQSELESIKLEVLEWASCVDEQPVDISLDLAKLLQKPEGQTFFLDNKVIAAVSVKDEKPFLLTSDDDGDTKQRMEALFDRQVIKISDAHIQYMKSAKWATLRKDLSSELMIINVSDTKRGKANREIVVEGEKEAVDAAISKIRRELEKMAVEEKTVPMASGVARLIKEEKSRLEEIKEKSGADVWIKHNERKGSFECCVSGKDDKVSEATRAVKELRQEVKHDDITLTNKGIEDLITDQKFKASLLAFEMKHRSVIEANPPQEEKFSSQRYHGDHEEGTGRQAGDGDSANVYANKDVNIVVSCGNITTFDADILVNTIAGQEVNLDEGGRISAAFSKSGGPRLQQEVDQEVERYVSNRADSEEEESRQKVIITKARGSLRQHSDKIFHINIGRWTSKSEKKLTELIQDCLYRATNVCRKRSIAFPVIGAGRLSYPQDIVAHCFKRAAEFAGRKQSKITVYIVAYDRKTQHQIADEFGGSRHKQRTSVWQQDDDRIWYSQRGHGKGVQFHVYAWSNGQIRETIKSIQNLVERSLSRITVPLNQDAACDIDLVKRLKRMNTQSLSVWIDFPNGQVKISGAGTEASKARGKVLSLIQDSANTPKTLSGRKGELVKFANETDKLPDYWTSFTGHLSDVMKTFAGKEASLVPLDPKMLQNVSQLFNQTSQGRAVVKKIERVENPELWLNYLKGRSTLLYNAIIDKIPPFTQAAGQAEVVTRTLNIKDLDDMLIPEINEVFLFHGTSHQNVKGVVNQGLDFRLGACGSFGQGTYFADVSSTSIGYSRQPDASGCRYMFVARVMLGHIFPTPHCLGIHRPPCVTCKNEACMQHDDFYDSVIGNREFIVYDKHRCYPEYLITY